MTSGVVSPRGVPFGSLIESRASVPYQREADVVVGMWREVERDLAAARADLARVDPATPEATRLDVETARLIDDWALLRAEYQRLTDAARRHHRPEPPAWPEAEPTSSI